MGIQVAGLLRKPDATPAANAALRITSVSNFGEVLISARLLFNLDAYGQYDFNLEFGEYLVEVRYADYYEILGRISVHQNCANPSALNVLLAKSKQLTPDEISYLENLLSDTQLLAGQVSTAKIIIESMRNEVEADRAEVEANTQQVAQDAADTRDNTLTVIVKADEVEADRAEVAALAAQVRQDAIDARNARNYLEQHIVDPDAVFPEPPSSVNAKVFDTYIELYPVLASIGYYTSFEYFIRGTDPLGARVFVSRGRTGSMQGLLPDTTYYFSVRTINNIGASAYVDVTAKTSAFGLAERQLLGLQPDANLGDILAQMDQDLTNMDSLLADQTVQVDLITTSQQDLTNSVNTSLATMVARQDEYEQRLLEGESLIDAVVFRDPDTGQIVNHAFEYADGKYSEASLRLDGMDATINIHAENISQTTTTLQVHSADITVLQSTILSKVSYTEVDSKIAGALAALEPAYSWQFNTGTDGWANATWVTQQGRIDFVSPITMTGISFVGEDNPVVRITAKTPDYSTTALFLSWNGGGQNIPFPLNSVNDAWETLILELSVAEGWTGTITDLAISGTGSGVQIDSIVIGKRDAAAQQLAAMEVRTTNIEQTLDAENARWSVYVTNDFWNANALTAASVSQIIDGWDAQWGIKAVITQINDQGTISKANSASTWINAADANITQVVSAWWNASEDKSTLTSVSLELDGLNNQIVQNVNSISGINSEQTKLGLEQVQLAYRQFLDANNLAALQVTMAAAQSSLSAVTTEQSALAQSVLDLEAASSAADARMQTIEQTVVDETQARASSEQQLAVTMTDNLAEAKLYTRSSVNYWKDATGNMVEAPADPNNPPVGWTLVAGPLSEDIRQLKVTLADGSTASLANIAQVFQNESGKVVARGGLLINNSGRITGFVANDDGAISNLDLIGESVRIGYEDAGLFYPVLYFNTQSRHMEMVGSIKLTDGYVVTSQDDIRALDGINGDTIYVEYSHSADDVNWHSDALNGDVYQRRRTVTNGVPGAWSVSYRFRGEDGYTPQKGVDYFDGKHGAFHSYIFATAATRPATPVGGSYDGTLESVPAGWLDNPTFTAGQITWVSHRVYIHNGSSWVPGAWSVPSEYSIKGDPGSNGTNGLNNAIVFLYQRSVGTPVKPSTTATYTFSSKALTGFNNGWSTTIPAGTNPLWAIAATASSNGATDTIAGTEWSDPVVAMQNGQDGLNSATVMLFRRYVSTPAVPSTTATYTFTTAALTGHNNSWSTSIPDGVDPVWMITATAVAYGPTDTILASEWSAPKKLAVNGTNGSNGMPGAGMYTIVSATGSWPGDASANTQFYAKTGRYPEKGDVLTFAKSDRSFATTKEAISSGSSAVWSTPTMVVDGSIVALGSITGAQIKAGTSITTPLLIAAVLQGGSININNKFMVDSAGNLTATAGTFSGALSAATGTFAGDISAANGNFTGTVQAGKVLGAITILGSGQNKISDLSAFSAESYVPRDLYTANTNSAGQTRGLGGGTYTDEFENTVGADILMFNTGIVVPDWFWKTKALGVSISRAGTWWYKTSQQAVASSGFEAAVVPMQNVSQEATYNDATIWIRMSLHSKYHGYTKDSMFKWKIYEILGA